MEKALLVSIFKKGEPEKQIVVKSLELESLAETAEAIVERHIKWAQDNINPATYLSKGRVEELALIAEELSVDLVVFGVDLKPSHQRNIENILKVKTIDRTQLILDIFARHAVSMEGKMQVELAQLKYLLPRLAGKGLLLSRLGGGIGTRGPGETKLEVDRRRIAHRIAVLQRHLRQYKEHRQRLRAGRRRKDIPLVSIVGYTSAGKSTLLNALTGAGQKESEMLFTTLDTLSRNVRLKDGRMAVVSDTVGFLDGLPHTLIEAFKGTLEEVVYSDAMIVVIDAADEDWRRKSEAVIEVLDEIGAVDIPQIFALNKIDKSPEERGVMIEIIKRHFSGERAVAISAKERLGIDGLLSALTEALQPNLSYLEVLIPYSKMDIVHRIYGEGKVVERKDTEDGIVIKGYLPEYVMPFVIKGTE